MLGNIGEKILGGLSFDDTYNMLDDDIEIEDGLDGYEDSDEAGDDEIDWEDEESEEGLDADYEDESDNEYDDYADESDSEYGDYADESDSEYADESDGYWESDDEELDIGHRDISDMSMSNSLAYTEWSNGYCALDGDIDTDGNNSNISGRSILDELSSGIIDVGSLDDTDNDDYLGGSDTLQSLKDRIAQLETEVADYCSIKEERDRLLNVVSTKESEYKSLSADFDKLAEIAAEHKGKYNQLALAYKKLQARYSAISAKFKNLNAKSEKIVDSSGATKHAEIAKENIVDKIDTDGGQDCSVHGHLSKQEYYSSLSIEKLYSVLAEFLASKGVGKKPVEKEILVNEFGAGNVNKLIIKSYLVPLGSKVTMGKVMN